VIVPVAALSPELRRSCNERYRLRKASGHLLDDQTLAPLWQGIELNEMWVDSHLHALINPVMVLNQGSTA
jgi:hypothetical protein